MASPRARAAVAVSSLLVLMAVIGMGLRSLIDAAFNQPTPPPNAPWSQRFAQARPILYGPSFFDAEAKWHELEEFGPTNDAERRQWVDLQVELLERRWLDYSHQTSVLLELQEYWWLAREHDARLRQVLVSYKPGTAMHVDLSALLEAMERWKDDPHRFGPAAW